MSEARPDTDGRSEPGGTPSPGPDNLVQKPVAPGLDDAGTATPTPGVTDPGDDGRHRGTEADPGD